MTGVSRNHTPTEIIKQRRVERELVRDRNELWWQNSVPSIAATEGNTWEFCYIPQDVPIIHEVRQWKQLVMVKTVLQFSETSISAALNNCCFSLPPLCSLKVKPHLARGNLRDPVPWNFKTKKRHPCTCPTLTSSIRLLFLLYTQLTSCSPVRQLCLHVSVPASLKVRTFESHLSAYSTWQVAYSKTNEDNKNLLIFKYLHYP